MTDKKLTIGRVARLSGVNIETIRYYERRGLVEQPSKPSTGYRIYPPELLQRIRFIRRAQTLGFTLKEIERLLSLGDNNCEAVQEVATEKLREVRNKVRDLNNLERVLAELLCQCEQRQNELFCPIVESLGSTTSQ